MSKPAKKVTINERIAELMRRHNLSSREFAKTLGMKYGQVYHVVAGDLRKPSWELLQAILTHYPEASPEWLLLHDQDDGSQTVLDYQPSDDLDQMNSGELKQAVRRAESSIFYLLQENIRLKNRIIGLQEKVNVMAAHIGKIFPDLEDK